MNLFCTKGAIRNDITFQLREKVQLTMSKSSEKIGRQKFDPSDFEIVNVDIDVPELPNLFDKYRIVHISDIHYGQWISASRLEGVVKLINKQNPDLVAITGDFVSYSSESVEDLIPILSKLEPKDATVAVLGNHDHWLGAKKVRSILRNSHVIDLSNDVYSVRKGNTVLHIAGVDSITVKRDRLDKVVKKLPRHETAVLLCHEPDFADVSAATRKFQLQLSGHSHGGQFIIPELGTPLRGNNFMKYPHGLYHVEDMTQYTSRGIGTNGFWIRINCAPEISVLDLQAS